MNERDPSCDNNSISTWNEKEIGQNLNKVLVISSIQILYETLHLTSFLII